jgi:fatty acid desaturase
MAQRPLNVNFVSVAPAIAAARQNTGLFQIGHDALHGTFGNSHAIRNVA